MNKEQSLLGLILYVSIRVDLLCVLNKGYHFLASDLFILFVIPTTVERISLFVVPYFIMLSFRLSSLGYAWRNLIVRSTVLYFLCHFDQALARGEISLFM